MPVYGDSVVADLSAKGFAQSIDGSVVVGIDDDLDSTLPMISANQAIEIATACCFGDIQGSDIYVTVTNTQSASEAYLAVSEAYETPQPEPGPEPEPEYRGH